MSTVSLQKDTRSPSKAEIFLNDKEMKEKEACPLCNETFELIELISHVETCEGNVSDEEDTDLKLARQLQDEEDQKQRERNSKTKCQKCQKQIQVEDIYILDDCGHKFCRECLKEHVTSTLYKTATIVCPTKDCKAQLSVRDVKEFSPNYSSDKKSMFKSQASGTATERLMSELKQIMNSDSEKNGFTAEPIDDNLYQWEICLFNFDSPMKEDMKQLGMDHVTMHAVFPKSYPFTPPYIRVIEPRFAFRTGHITIGGSICFELLTLSHWTPDTRRNLLLCDTFRLPYTKETATSMESVPKQHVPTSLRLSRATTSFETKLANKQHTKHTNNYLLLNLTMRNAIALLLLALSATSVWADTCQSGYSWCSGINACYDPSQYDCVSDQYNGQNRLCGLGTFSCNDVCIASCAYQCGTDGGYTIRSDRTCPAPPACVNDNTIACGDACYDKTKFCCVSGQPQDITTCPPPTSPVSDTTSTCPFGIYNVASLLDGQLRMNLGRIAPASSFNLSAGALYDQKGLRYSISSNGQLQASITPDNLFAISGDFLSRNGSLVWYLCPAAASNGSNLFVRKINNVACYATYLYVTLSCPTLPAALSTKPITFTLPSSSDQLPAATTYISPTSSIPLTTAPCVPGGVTIPVPFTYYSFDSGIANGLLKDDSGKGRYATLLGLPKSIEGKTKLGLSFNSSQGLQGLRMDQTAGLDGDFSITTWLKVLDSDKVMKIVSTKKGLFSQLTGWELSLSPKTKTVTFTSGFSSVSWKIDYTNDTWFHLAFTAEKTGKVNLYINGVAGATQTIPLSKCTGSLYIASDKFISNFKGALDDFLLFNQTLSVQHILSIISNRCLPVTVPSTDNIVSTTTLPPTPTTKIAGKKCGLPWLYWSFDKIKLAKCIDDSGHGRHGSFSTDFSLIAGKLRHALSAKNNTRLFVTLPQFELYKLFTVATWLRLNSTVGKIVIASTKTIQTGWELTFDGNAKTITFQSSLGSSVSWNATSLRADAWVHVAVAVGVDRAELFLDANSSGINVGGKLSAFDPLRGSLDEFLVFDRVLDREEITDARDKYLTGAVVPATSWSKQTDSYDWGVGWELASALAGLRLDRLQNWWIF
ncbi:hypothetical protein PROFUN_06496 [Planoprotostelium fungivorum]|uniref:UBC core domain-containing protein n=1 Tax=Planoprotostelium fungivorum TaxID=1890364 RepID=A0A2P6NNY8_9EUKA|nr:hypothetical protein PROFUN_06496 [Planoprotostelium fungivorum]